MLKWSQVYLEDTRVNSVFTLFSLLGLFYPCLNSFMATSPTWTVIKWPQKLRVKELTSVPSQWLGAIEPDALRSQSDLFATSVSLRKMLRKEGLALYPGAYFSERVTWDSQLLWREPPPPPLFSFSVENTPLLCSKSLASLTYCILRRPHLPRLQFFQSPLSCTLALSLPGLTVTAYG